MFDSSNSHAVTRTDAASARTVAAKGAAPKAPKCEPKALEKGQHLFYYSNITETKIADVLSVRDVDRSSMGHEYLFLTKEGKWVRGLTIWHENNCITVQLAVNSRGQYGYSPKRRSTKLKGVQKVCLIQEIRYVFWKWEYIPGFLYNLSVIDKDIHKCSARQVAAFLALPQSVGIGKPKSAVEEQKKLTAYFKKKRSVH